MLVFSNDLLNDYSNISSLCSIRRDEVVSSGATKLARENYQISRQISLLSRSKICAFVKRNML